MCVISLWFADLTTEIFGRSDDRFHSYEKCECMLWSVLGRPAECQYVAKSLTVRFSRTLSMR